MLDRTRAQAVDALLGAYELHTPVVPLSETFPGIDVDDAYAIQRAQVDHWLASGRRIVGHKVGLTSVAVQKQLGVSQPDFGHLFDDMFHLSGAPIGVGTYLQPRVEPEIAFILKEDLVGPGLSVADAIRSVDSVVGSLEIIDSRIADWRISLADTIADNASSGGVVLGTRPMPIDAVDLRLLGVVLRRNGRIEQTGVGGAVLGSPISSLVWLANTLGQLGTPLRTGAVVLAGAVTATVPALPGDVISATFAGLGTVTAVFAPDPAPTSCQENT